MPRAGVTSICCMSLMHRGLKWWRIAAHSKCMQDIEFRRYKLWKKTWWISLMNKNFAQTYKAWGGTLIPGKHRNHSWEGPCHFASMQLMQNDKLLRSKLSLQSAFQIASEMLWQPSSRQVRNHDKYWLQIPKCTQSKFRKSNWGWNKRTLSNSLYIFWRGAAQTSPYPIHNVHTCCKAWGPVSDQGNVLNCVLKFRNPFALWRVVPFTTVHSDRDEFKTFQGPVTRLWTIYGLSCAFEFPHSTALLCFCKSITGINSCTEQCSWRF